MRRLTQRAHASAMVLAALATVGAGARAGEARRLRYKFTEGARSTYALHVEYDLSTRAEQGERKQESSRNTKLDLVMEVVEHERKAGARAKPTLGVTFRDLKVEQKLTGPAGDIDVAIESGEVTVKRRGMVVIDTKEGKGKDLAKRLLKEFAFLGKEGTLTVDSSGRVSAVDGPEEFKSFLAADTRAGVWVLETGTEPVRVGESWESAERKIERFRGLDLSKNPLTVRLRYTLTEVTEEGGRKIARIAVKSVSATNVTKDISANVSNQSLSRVPVDIARFERTVEGTVEFDVDAGRVVKSDLKIKLDVEVEMKVWNENTRKEEVVKTKISGTATTRAELRPPEESKEKADAKAE